jgi:hypothetical protein
MDRWDFSFAVGKLALLGCYIPDDLVDLVVLELVKDTVRGNHHVVKLVGTFHLMNHLCVTGNNAFHASHVE